MIAFGFHNFPTTWKEAIVVALPEPVETTNPPRSHLISLSSTAAKYLRRMVSSGMLHRVAFVRTDV
jgi:hypothetical protein